MFEIGNSLREARERRSIELVQAEGATKIRTKYLRALEEEQFELLPSETYVKGFLRTYADYLGLDGQLYVDEFNSRFVVDDREHRTRRSSARPQQRNRRSETTVVLLVLSVIAIVTVIVISAWKSAGGDTASKAPAKTHARKHVAAKPAGPYLVLKGSGGSSSVAIRSGGATGDVVYEGTVERGETLPFRGKRYWLNVSSPEHLVITVAGRRVTIAGRRPRVITVTPNGWHAS